MDVGRPVMLEASDGIYGSGVYALDLGYDNASRDRLRWECFGDSRPEHPMDGVLVIEPGLCEEPFEYVEGHIWLMEVPPRRPVAIDSAIVTTATWSQRGGWRTIDCG